MRRRFLCHAALVLCALLALAGQGDAASKALPFRQGERLVYRALWGFIPAGEAVIEVLPDAGVEGVRAHHFAMTTTTNSRIDLFYKIRERQDSYADIAMTRTLQYRKKSTGDHPRDVIVTYDWKNRTATYASFGNAEKPVEILPGTFDPNRKVIPSSGCTRITRAFLPSSSVMVASKGRWGARLNTSAISVTRRPSRLPVRR